MQVRNPQNPLTRGDLTSVPILQIPPVQGAHSLIPQSFLLLSSLGNIQFLCRREGSEGQRVSQGRLGENV